MKPLRRLLLCSLFLAALAGCAQTPPAGRSAIWRDDIVFALTGVLAAADPEPGAPADCPVLITDDGRIFALIGDLRAFIIGERVEIVGPPAIWSTCQTYRVIRADMVTRLR